MKHLVVLLIALWSTSCVSQKASDQIFIERGSPESVDVNPELVNKLITDINSNKIQNIHGLLIIKDDKLITEEYFGDFDRNRLQYSASVSKSFASTLLGIAIDQGYFDDDIPIVLNKPVADLFPKFEETIKEDISKNDLQLRHILSMTAGLEWDEHTYPYSDSRNDCNRINNSDNPMQFLFERKLIRKPGEEFYYNGGLSLSISYLIEKYTNMRVDKFAEKFLFAPLGIRDYRWERLANGLVDTDGGLHIKPIDQAKLGYLFLNNGYWKDQQIVSKEWVTTSTTMHKKNEGMPDYGYQWWGGDYGADNQTYSMYMASGHGGQKIVVIPQFNAVIVITQQVFENQFGDLNFIAMMSDYLIPALANTPANNQTFSIQKNQLPEYEGHYALDDNSEHIDFTAQDHALIGVSSDGQTNTFIPISEHVFRTRIMDLINIEIEFIEDLSGDIVGMKSDFAFNHKQYYKRVD